ncbi:MAG: amino acid permease [Proteobacteria bacterium]|nr:amino acid permease [Pseudomonadota bacterium]
MSGKIGFWSVFELVTISQIGSGLMLPANLAAYGHFSLVGWIMSSVGAVLLAVMFALLCTRFPRTGGPHAYVQEAFGRTASYFTGWTYWVISWVSTSAIIISAVGYILPLIGSHSHYLNLALEIIIVAVITTINLRGVYSAGNARFIWIVFKMIPLLLVPICALFFFDKSNFTVVTVSTEDTSSLFNSVMLLTFWGFIGFEAATAAAADVKDLRKTIPRALIFGTIFVAIVYFISSLGIMGAIPADELINSAAPYSDTAKLIFGGKWHLIVSFIACIVCITAVNAWTLASGQIALGLAQDRLLPKQFGLCNKHGAPVFALILSGVGTIPLLILTHHESLAEKVNTVIDMSVTAFLFVYIISCLAYLKLLVTPKRKEPLWKWLCGVVSLCFCLWIVFSTPLKTIGVATIFVLSGLPIYLLQRMNSKSTQPSDDSQTPYISETP